MTEAFIKVLIVIIKIKKSLFAINSLCSAPHRAARAKQWWNHCKVRWSKATKVYTISHTTPIRSFFHPKVFLCPPPIFGIIFHSSNILWILGLLPFSLWRTNPASTTRSGASVNLECRANGNPSPTGLQDLINSYLYQFCFHLYWSQVYIRWQTESLQILGRPSDSHIQIHISHFHFAVTWTREEVDPNSSQVTILFHFVCAIFGHCNFVCFTISEQMKFPKTRYLLFRAIEKEQNHISGAPKES